MTQVKKSSDLAKTWLTQFDQGFLSGLRYDQLGLIQYQKCPDTFF